MEYKKIPFLPCSITGGMPLAGDMEPGEVVRPVDHALIELHEEAGAPIAGQHAGGLYPHDLVPLGTVRPSKSADTVVYLFTVNLNKISLKDPEGDGTQGEDGAYCAWRRPSTAVNKCDDPLVHTMFARMDQKKIWETVEP
jgi:hypothetical protein